MASKFTKVTAPASTGALWRKWVRVRFTAEASAGPPSSRSLRSRHSELFVLADLARRGWRELTHDVSCGGVQIDLVGRAPSGTLTIVEVKMQSARGLARLSFRQRARLYRAASVLAQCEPVQLAVALVEAEKVRLLPVDALTQT